MLMFLLSCAWAVATLFLAVVVLIFVSQSLAGALLFFLILYWTWKLAKKDWGFSRYFIQTPGQVRPTVNKRRPTYDELRTYVAEQETVERGVARVLARKEETIAKLTALDPPSFGIDPDAMP